MDCNSRLYPLNKSVIVLELLVIEIPSTVNEASTPSLVRDRFFVEVPTNKAQSLLKWIFNNKYEELKEIVRDRFTSRDD